MTQLLSFSFAVGQTAKSITICGRWDGFSISDDVTESVRNTATVVVYEKHLRPDYMNHHVKHEITIKRDSFHQVIPLTKENQYIKFANFGGVVKGYPDDNQTLEPFYLVSPGDSIHIHRPRNGSIVLSGDSPFLNYQFSVYSSLRPAALRTQLGAIRQNLEAQRRRIETNFHTIDSISDDFEISDSSYLTSLLRLNFEMQVLSSVYSMLYADMLYGEQDSITANIRTDFNGMFSVHEPVLDERLILESSKYLEYLFYLHSAKGTIQARVAGFSSKDHFHLASYIYNSIIENTHEFIRERLIDMFFKWSVNIRLLGAEASPLIQEAMTIVNDVEIGRSLQHKLNGFSGGESVPDAAFEDLDGGKVSLHDFKGKLIVAHFWFLGCKACIDLTENLKPLFATYTSNPEVVFLNINVDRTRERWLMGLRSQKYSHDNELVLHTGSIGVAHPLLKHYNYTGMPSLLIVDQQGKLVSSRPPFGDTPESYAELQRLIDSNLSSVN